MRRVTVALVIVPLLVAAVDPGQDIEVAARSVSTVRTQRESDVVVMRIREDRGERLPGGEVALTMYAGADPVARASDAGDGENDGVTVIEAVPPGYYLLLDSPPDGFAPTAPVVVNVLPGANELTIRSLPPDRVGTLTIERFGEGEPLPGGRVDVETPRGIYSVTDRADGEEDGRTILSGLVPGRYLVRDVPPPDYAASPPRWIRVGPGRNDLRIDTPLLATVTVERSDPAGEPLRGGEVSLRDEAETVIARTDDGADGRVDGVTTLAGVSAGAYVLVDSGPPPGYGPAEDLPITLNPGENRVTVENPQAPASLVIATTQADGAPLRGACYDVLAERSRVAATCDGFDGASDGTATIANLPPGAYTVLQSWVPIDFVLAPGQRVTVEPNTTARMTVVTSLRPQ